jgi:predicted transcriptional regulator
VPEWPELDQLQGAIVRLLTQRGGQPIPTGDIAVALNTNHFRVSKALEDLHQFGLIEAGQDVLRGQLVLLTRRGRDFVLAHGLA